MGTNQPLVFISHSSQDAPIAEETCAALELRDMKVWMAPRDIPVGGDHAHEAFLAIGQCSAVVVLLSWAAYESPFVRREAELAISLRTPVYPISIIPGMAGPRSRWGHYEGTRPYGWEFLIQGLQILYVPNVTVAVNEVVARLVGTSTSGSEPG